MKLKQIILLITLLLMSYLVALAESRPESLCDNLKSEAKDAYCEKDDPTEFISDFREYYLKQFIVKLQKKNEFLLYKLRNQLRDLNKNITDLYPDFLKLKELTPLSAPLKDIHVRTSPKNLSNLAFDEVCKDCDSETIDNRKAQIKHIKAQLDQEKLRIFLKNPLLAEEGILKLLEHPTNIKTFHKVFEKSLQRKITSLEQKQKVYNKFKAEGNNGNLKDYPEILEDIVLSGIDKKSIWAKKIYFCELQELYITESKKYKDRQKLTKKVIFATSLFPLVPVGRIPYIVALLGRHGLLRSASVYASVSAGVANYTLSAKEYFDIISECEQQEINFAENSNESNYRSLNACRNNKVELGRSIANITPLASIGALKTTHKFWNTFHSPFLREGTVALLKKHPPHTWLGTQTVLSFPTNKGDHMNIIDIGKAKQLGDSETLKIVDNYLKELSSTYKKRKLPAGLIQGLIRVNNETAKNGVLILNTSKSIADPNYKINGGVIAFFSKSSKEPLPMQLETASRNQTLFNFDRNPEEVIVEIGRLTRIKANDDTLVSDMIAATAQIAVSNSKVKTIYIYTNTTLEKLYLKKGFPVQRIQEMPVENGIQDVILKVDAKKVGQIIDQKIQTYFK